MDELFRIGLLTITSMFLALSFMWVNLKAGSRFGKRTSYWLMWLLLLFTGYCFILFSLEALVPSR